VKLYGKIKYSEEDVFGLYDIPPHIVIKLKSVFKQIHKNSFQPFLIQKTNESCADLEWFFLRYPFEINDDTKSIISNGAEKYRQFIDESNKIIAGNYLPIECQLNNGYKLYPYQQQAVDLFRKVKRLLIADEVGLGKSIQAIASILDKEYLPAIIVVQPHLVNQWNDMVQEYSNLRSYPVTKDLPIDWREKDVLVIKYTTASKYIDEFKQHGFKTLILDEVQEVRREESIKHRACFVLSQIIPNCIALSGTPIVNYGNEVYNIYKIINQSVFPDYREFLIEWLGFKDRVQNPEALGSYLRDTFSYIRRTKSDVKSEIPPINKIIQTVGFDDDAIDKIKADAKTLALSVLQGSFIERGQAARELSVLIRKATGVSKAKYVAEYVKMILANKEKVLVALWHRECYDIITEELKEYNPVWYSGTETPSQKEKSKQKFISGESQVMLISLRSGVGLDGLQEFCSYVVFGELDWTNAYHDQVAGRLYRHGQKEQVTAIFLISDSGSDPIVIDILGLKKDQFTGIFNPDAKPESIEHDESIIKEFAKRYLEKL